MNGDAKNFSSVQTFIEVMPDIKHLVTQPNAINNIPSNILKLIAWVVDTVPLEGMIIEKVSLDQYKRETAGIDSKQSKISDPNYVFKITYTQDHPGYKSWETLVRNKEVTLGFHGSAFENYHSIIRNGLDNSFGKDTSLFGDGIYLSEDRDVAFSFLKCGPNYYQNSLFGKQVGCIVCAEVIKDPQHVRVSTDQAALSGISLSDSKLPKGYIVVESNEYVCIRYILVYEHFMGTTRKKTNFCVLCMIAYVLLLMYFSLVRSSTVQFF